MLPAAHRLTDAESFRVATRRGRHASSRTLVTHLVVPDEGVSGTPGAPRAGFVVNKTVGGSVVRNRVQRRLRHLVRDRVAALPDTALLVVRALPPAASAGYDELAHDLDRCLARCLARGGAAA